MDNNSIQIFSRADAVYLSASFCEMVNSQSCDCDSIVIRSGDNFVVLNYKNINNDGCIDWKSLPSFDKNEYPYEVNLSDNVFIFDKFSYTDKGLIDGIRFSANDAFLFIFGSEHNLILTISRLDLFEEIKTDFPEAEASLKIISHE